MQLRGYIMLQSTKYKILEKGKYAAEGITKSCLLSLQPARTWFLLISDLFFTWTLCLCLFYLCLFVWLSDMLPLSTHCIFLCLVLASVLFWAACLCLSFLICLCVFSSLFVWSDYQRLWARAWSTGHYLELKLALITSPVSVHCVK